MKKEIEDVTSIVEMTQGMIDAIKTEMRKFNSYDKFLYSVEAMKEQELPVVLKYPNERLDWYENTYVKKFVGNSINNLFVFKKYANLKKNTATEGKPIYIDSCYFIPRMFWDFVGKQKSSTYSNFTPTEDYKQKIIDMKNKTKDKLKDIL